MDWPGASLISGALYHVKNKFDGIFFGAQVVHWLIICSVMYSGLKIPLLTELVTLSPISVICTKTAVCSFQHAHSNAVEPCYYLSFTLSNFVFMCYYLYNGRCYQYRPENLAATTGLRGMISLK